MTNTTLYLLFPLSSHSNEPCVIFNKATQGKSIVLTPSPLPKASIHTSIHPYIQLSIPPSIEWMHPDSFQGLSLLQQPCWVTHAQSDAQKHFQSCNPIAHPMSISIIPPASHQFCCQTICQMHCCLNKAKQLRRHKHSQQPFRRTFCKFYSFYVFFLFSFHITTFFLVHPPPLCRKPLWHIKCQRQKSSFHKNRCFFNCPSLGHNQLNEDTHKIDCSTCVEGGSVTQLV